MDLDKEFRKKESRRVQAYRRKKAKEGFKNISFVVSPEEYQEIEQERERLGLSTKELLFYYLRGQFGMEGKGYWTHGNDDHLDFFDPNFDLSMPEFLEDILEKNKLRGEAFDLKTERRKQSFCKYVIVQFVYQSPQKNEKLEFFPFEMRCANKGYDSYQEAMIAYLMPKPKLKLRKNAQHTLLERVYCKDPKFAHSFKHWYIPVFHFKEFYPDQLSLTKNYDDPQRPDYQAEFESISRQLGLMEEPI